MHQLLIPLGVYSGGVGTSGSCGSSAFSFSGTPIRISVVATRIYISVSSRSPHPIPPVFVSCFFDDSCLR